MSNEWFFSLSKEQQYAILADILCSFSSEELESLGQETFSDDEEGKRLLDDLARYQKGIEARAN